MKFSQRIGITSAIKQPKIEVIDSDLKNGLWNSLKLFVLDPLEKYRQYSGVTEWQHFCTALWYHHFKWPIDTISQYSSKSEAVIRDHFFNCQWYEIYDLIDFIASLESDNFDIDQDGFCESCNLILEREFAGYRIINSKVAPITNPYEVEEIETALEQTTNFTSLKGSNIHLRSALQKLSDKQAPDYRNSIKESVSAIESIAKVISGKSNDSLGSALDRIKGKISLHSALERGFKQLYGYTSDSDGIRHALMDDHNCDFEDAKYMLVSSSAFINYLIVKANKAGVKL